MEPYAIDPDTQWENSVKLLGDFDAYRTAYKFVNSQPIYAFFIIPKQLRTGLSPLLVRFHGGGFSEGEAEASLRPLCDNLYAQVLSSLSHANCTIVSSSSRLNTKLSLSRRIIVCALNMS